MVPLDGRGSEGLGKRATVCWDGRPGRLSTSRPAGFCCCCWLSASCFLLVLLLVRRCEGRRTMFSCFFFLAKKGLSRGKGLGVSDGWRREGEQATRDRPATTRVTTTTAGSRDRDACSYSPDPAGSRPAGRSKGDGWRLKMRSKLESRAV